MSNVPLTLGTAKFYLAIGAIAIASFFIAFVYPRPFKDADFSEYLISGVEGIEPEFRYRGLWSGCEVQVQLAMFSEPSSIGILDSDLERRFSPWIPSLDGILHQEAYFNTLEFEECFAAMRKKYPGLEIKSAIFEGESNTALRIGGIKEFSQPLSHANTIMIFANWKEQAKIILIRGGD